MNQQPDKFFRDRLYDYEKQVSPRVWNRVSGYLPAKKNNLLWISIAAGVALLITASILIIQFPDRTGTSVATNTGQAATPSAAQPGAPHEKTPASEQGPSDTPSKHPNTTVPEGTRKNDLPVRKKSESSTPTPVVSPDKILKAAPEPVEIPTDAALLSNATNPAGKNPSMTDAANTEKNENITIVLTAKEVNEKYLKKKNVVTQATSEEKASSGLRKLLDKASDLKYNQDPFGDLRQKKNEILALNFKNSKRNENR